MTNPPFRIPKAVLVYDGNGRPTDILLDGEPFPAAISAAEPITAEFHSEAEIQTVTVTFFVRDFATETRR
jgi:hypothetical protein